MVKGRPSLATHALTRQPILSILDDLEPEIEYTIQQPNDEQPDLPLVVVDVADMFPSQQERDVDALLHSICGRLKCGR